MAPCECGMICLTKSAPRRFTGARFISAHTLRFKTAKVNKRRNIFKCEEIAEEWDAWKRGFNLANRLGIELDKEDYYNYASRWVMTYIRKAA